MTSEAVQHEAFTVPIDEAPYDRLTQCAGRTLFLLEHPVVQESEEMKSSLDELLGSIYSLITAHKLNFEDRIKKKKEDSVILDVAKELSQGIVRTDGKWMAGYFMNSATYRTSSVYHRFLKIVAANPSQDIGKLLPLVGAAFKQWTAGSHGLTANWTAFRTKRTVSNTLRQRSIVDGHSGRNTVSSLSRSYSPSQRLGLQNKRS